MKTDSVDVNKLRTDNIAHYGHATAIAALAESGKADLNLEDNEGLRPIDLACMKGHWRAATAILDAGGVMGAGTKSRRAARLWSKARTSLVGDVREGRMPQCTRDTMQQLSFASARCSLLT